MKTHKKTIEKVPTRVVVVIVVIGDIAVSPIVPTNKKNNLKTIEKTLQSNNKNNIKTFKSN